MPNPFKDWARMYGANKQYLESQGRPSPAAVTYTERGNIQGAQFFAIAGAVYEAAKRQGLGREIPTEWFLQDIRN